ncbi:hypothetical protein FNL37_1758 [Methylovorus glucosotrophus]|nr:hypothetical protein FNL37_1758 [Methylovorus glucosotrophus]
MLHTSQCELAFVVRLISFRDIARENIEIASFRLGGIFSILWMI